MSSTPRPRGGLEREVLAALAASGRPMSATQVRADLGGGLAYTTVMTTLARLHAKAVLTRQMSGRAYVYAISGDPGSVEASLAAYRMRRVLDSRQDRAGVLARFVADLSSEDEQVLADVLAGRREREGGS
jgi:predicted transcriptional regulator